MTLDESKMLAIASINMISGEVNDTDHIKISEIKSDTKKFEIVNNNDVKKLMDDVKKRYPSNEKSSS